jgi:hypothetical protein
MSHFLKDRISGNRMNISKRNLLLVAAFVWTIASGILIARGSNWVFLHSDCQSFRLMAAILFGMVFYRLLFTRISAKHIARIRNMETDHPFFLSFFDGRGYLMMTGMIILGIVLRNIDVVNKDLLYTFYIGMGIPLLISAIRFYNAWLVYARV